MSSSFVSHSNESNQLLLSSRALQGALERIERMALSESSSYGDEGFEDSKYIDCPGE